MECYLQIYSYTIIISNTEPAMSSQTNIQVVVCNTEQNIINEKDGNAEQNVLNSHDGNTSNSKF